MATDSIILKVDKSPLHGYGVFAMEKISKGTTVLKSPYIDVTGCVGIIEKYYFASPEGKGKVILPLDRGALINHSDIPNLKYTVIDDKIVFTALKDIEVNDELSHRYL